MMPEKRSYPQQRKGLLPEEPILLQSIQALYGEIQRLQDTVD